MIHARAPVDRDRSSRTVATPVVTHRIRLSSLQAIDLTCDTRELLRGRFDAEACARLARSPEALCGAAETVVRTDNAARPGCVILIGVPAGGRDANPITWSRAGRSDVGRFGWCRNVWESAQGWSVALGGCGGGFGCRVSHHFHAPDCPGGGALSSNSWTGTDGHTTLKRDSGRAPRRGTRNRALNARRRPTESASALRSSSPRRAACRRWGHAEA